MITKTQILQFYCLPGTVLVITMQTRFFTKSFFFKDKSPGSRVFYRRIFAKVRFRLGALTFLRHQFRRKYLLMGLPLAPPIGEISYLL